MRLVADLSGTYPASEAEALNTAVAALGVDKIKNVLLYHAVAGKVLNPLQVLLSRSLTMANGGTVKVRGINLRDETDALDGPEAGTVGPEHQGEQRRDPHDRSRAGPRRRPAPPRARALLSGCG